MPKLFASVANDSLVKNEAGVPIGGGILNQATMFRLTGPEGASVNLNEATGAKQGIYTVPTGKRAIIMNVIVRDFSTLPVTSAVASLGFNAGVDDIVSLGSGPLYMGGVVTSTLPIFTFMVFGIAFGNHSIAAGEAGGVLGVKVTTPEGSALTAVVDIFGFLIDA